jgi:hypothetical protein
MFELECGCERPVRDGAVDSAVDSGSLLTSARAIGRAELRGDVRGCSERVGPGLSSAGLSSLNRATFVVILAKVERSRFYFLEVRRKSVALL